jgi:hypothetical protein
MPLIESHPWYPHFAQKYDYRQLAFAAYTHENSDCAVVRAAALATCPALEQGMKCHCDSISGM